MVQNGKGGRLQKTNFTSFLALSQDRQGEWTQQEDCLIGSHPSSMRLSVGKARWLDLVVECHAYSGVWVLQIGNQKKWIELYSEAPKFRSIPVWRSEEAVDLELVLSSEGSFPGSRGSELVWLGVESDSAEAADVDWTRADQCQPRLRVMANPFLSLEERLHLSETRRWEEGVGVVSRRMRGEGRDAWYEVGPYRIYFVPEGIDGELEPVQRSATNTILESFVWPVLFSEEAGIRQGDVVLDVGANIGTTTMLFSRLTGPEGRVIAIEPAFGRILERNLAANAIENATVVQSAVDCESGSAVFHISNYIVESSLVDEHCGESAFDLEVKVETLDTIVSDLQLARVDFVKMDIEGVEEEAILGARRMIEDFRPKWSISSYHRDREQRLQHDRIAKLLKALGYRVKEIEKKHIFAW